MTNPSSIYNSINKSISRRDFLAGLAALGILGQQQLEAFASQIDPLAGAERSILVIQLNGGMLFSINPLHTYYYTIYPKMFVLPF